MRYFKALGALMVLAALLVGAPILLESLTGPPSLRRLPHFNALMDATTRSVKVDWVSIAVKYGLWALWGAFALAVLVQLRAIYKGGSGIRIPGLGLLQGLAAVLLGAIILANPSPSAIPQPESYAISQSIFAPPAQIEQERPLEIEVEPVQTTGGAGSVLSSGVIGVLAFRRREAQRQRSAGMRLELPAGESSEALLEAQMRQVANSMSIDMVDRLLRALSDYQRFHGFPLPDIRAARMSAEAFEIYLAAPAHLPLPWISTDDALVWGISAAAAAGITPSAEAAAPFPTLVTLGIDAAGAHVMLDMEHVASLDIQGPAEVAHASIAAIATELATTPWADDIQVTLVGTLPELGPALNTGRIRHVHSLERVILELENRAISIKQALEVSGLTSLYEARGRGILVDAWTPEILLVGGEIPTHLRPRLAALLESVPRASLGAITVGGGGQWALVLDGDNPAQATLEPAGLSLRIQQFTPQEYADAISLLSGCHRLVPGPTWASNLTGVEPSFAELGAAQTAAAAMVSPATAPSAASAGSASHAPLVPVQQLRHPYVRVLGEVELEAPAGTVLAEKDRSQALELISYLALTPGATNEKLSAALWPGREPRNATRNSAVSRARRWLGADHSGKPYLPVATTAENFGTYSLNHVTTDWAEFLRLVGCDAATSPTSKLEKALALVRGRPFEGARAGKYTWAEYHVQEMLASIVDVAHEVSRRHLLAGNAPRALAAAQAGLRATPEDERLWRDAIRAQWAGGNHVGVWETVKKCRAFLDSLEVEAEEATEELIAQLHAEAARGPVRAQARAHGQEPRSGSEAARRPKPVQ